MMRPYGSAFFISLVAGRKEFPPSIVVILESARSADPPQNSGSTFAIALMTCPDEVRVATSLPASNTGRVASQPAGSSRSTNRFKSAARSGCALCHWANFPSHSLCNCAPRAFTARTCAKTSAGIANFSSGLRPSSTLVAAISSSPSADP